MDKIILRTLDAQIVRAKRYGFIPFTFDVDLKGKKARKNAQSNRLGQHAAVLSIVTSDSHPEISARLFKLSELLLGKKRAVQIATGESTPEKVKSGVCDLDDVQTSSRHAQEIIRRLEWYKSSGSVAYLEAAEKQASAAYKMFCDDKSSLPKAFAGDLRKTPSGELFPDFYFKGARLMHAFALLGEALTSGECPNVK